jgi:hypothetical protein
MSEARTYAVYFHASAIEALGEPFKPFLSDGADGPHVLCKDIDTAGAFCEMTVITQSDKGRPVEHEVMVPSSMVRLVISISAAEHDFGFG